MTDEKKKLQQHVQVSLSFTCFSDFSGIRSLNSPFLVPYYQGPKTAKTETGGSIIENFFEQSSVSGFHIMLGPGSRAYVESGSESARPTSQINKQKIPRLLRS